MKAFIYIIGGIFFLLSIMFLGVNEFIPAIFLGVYAVFLMLVSVIIYLDEISKKMRK